MTRRQERGALRIDAMGPQFDMLTKETERNFIVYPSWAELEARWIDLPRYFADPLRGGFFQPNFDPRRFGYPESIQPYELIDGPAGGGLIVWHGDPYRGRWLPIGVLTNGADLLEPNGVRNHSPDHDPHAPCVCFLEPHENGLWKFGIGKRTRIYNTSLSYEHVDSAGHEVFWAMRYKRPKGRARGPAGLKDVPEWSRAFGVEALRLDDPPAGVLAETAAWFTNPEYESQWFRAESQDTGLGYQFAVLVYIGNHLRHVAGPAMDSMHLMARIEGHPNFRRRWTRKN